MMEKLKEFGEFVFKVLVASSLSIFVYVLGCLIFNL